MTKQPDLSVVKILSLLAVIGLFTIESYAQQDGKALFNQDWKFQLGDFQLEEVQSLQEDWRTVELPHDWSIEGPFSPKWASGTGFLPGGIGWYKKDFSVDEYNEQLKYAIYFDGVYKNSEVWINGHYLGKRPYGFIPFQYDLTPYLEEANNTIIVKVDRENYADARYYTGSGIYRNVYLLTQNQVHFAQWGVGFNTPEINEKEATAHLDVEIAQGLQSDVDIDIRAVIKNSDGNKVSEKNQIVSVKMGSGTQTTMDLTIPDPKLWSPDQPNLYALEVELWADGKRMDRWTEKVGIRNFHFDASEGFFLNGEPTIMKGVCIHHDAGALGAAVPEEVWRNRLLTLKELGSNAIRMSHYPHQDYIYELCDELGFLVQDEAFDEWERPKNKWIEGWNAGTPGNDPNHDAFNEWAERDVMDMVRRTRNRPSIIMWSIGNEIDYPNDPYTHPVLDEGRNPQIYGKGYMENHPPASDLADISKVLVAAVKKIDTTRPVTAALAGVVMSNQTEYPDNLDIVGYNYQEYRYPEDHKNYPNRVIYGSENGDALEAWLAVSENQFISSQFLWTAFDFIGEARPWPSRSSGAGIIDLAGNPKPDFYFRQSLWSDRPMVYLGVTEDEKQVIRRVNISDSWTGSEGETKWVTCYTNADEVELFLNGKSLGKKEGVYQLDEMIAWEVGFQPGELKAIAYNDGKRVATYILNTPGDVAKIVGELSKSQFSETHEIIELNMRLTDAEGNLVETSDLDLVLSIDGPAEIIGLESGDLTSHEDYQANNRKTYKGRLKAYIRTTSNAAPIRIKVTNQQLPEVEFNINNR